MLQDILLLIAGLVLLIGGGHFLVEAGVGAARKFRIAPFVIGATVVAFGTSAPELLVSLDAAMGGHPEMALGNIVGSNIANIALVLGATACLITLPVVSKRLFNDWLIVIASSVLLILFAMDGHIGLWEGLVLFLILHFYILAAIRSPKEDYATEDSRLNSWPLIILIFFLSCLGLSAGANLLVNSASNIALALNISEQVVSITIVAFGTSLPELTTSIIAALKKQTDISIGNIIGSNLFNILAVMGMTTIVHPIAISFHSFSKDLYLMLGIAILLMLLIYPFKTNIIRYKKEKTLKALAHLDAGQLNWKGGVVLLIIYALYIWKLLVSQ